MTQREHVSPGKPWNELVVELNEDVDSKHHQELADVYKFTHTLSKKYNLLPSVVLPVVKRVYLDAAPSKRTFIVNSINEVLALLVETKDYQILDDFEKVNKHLDMGKLENSKTPDICANHMVAIKEDLEKALQCK